MNTPGPLSPRDFEWVRKFVREQAAIQVEDGKEYLVESRLARVVREQRLESLATLVQRLRSERFGALHSSVIESMTTNETSFFRDRSFFETLREGVLPFLIEARQSAHRLNFWCGASSSGQEPYSVLMLMEEAFPELANWQLEFFASDLSEKMVARTRAGVYGEHEVRRGLAQGRMDRFLRRTTSGYQVNKCLRDRLKVLPINLIDAWPPMPDMDVIFLRNVLIYFDDATRTAILRRVCDRLAPDGLLFLGGSETLVSTEIPIVRELEFVGCYRLNR